MKNGQPKISKIINDHRLRFIRYRIIDYYRDGIVGVLFGKRLLKSTKKGVQSHLLRVGNRRYIQVRQVASRKQQINIEIVTPSWKEFLE